MRVRVSPGGQIGGVTSVPGDKSIAHRWLILASTARGTSRLTGLPASLDVRSTAGALASITTKPRPALDLWAEKAGPSVEDGGSTWNGTTPSGGGQVLEVEGEGRRALVQASRALDCGNSGTSMRLLAGVLAPASIRAVLAGDASLSTRPMERVAEPLRRMGATVRTTDGHAPIEIVGAPLRGIRFEPGSPSAQVKGAVLFAAAVAEGATEVLEPLPTRDHTERAFRALGADIRCEKAHVVLSRPFQHEGFDGRVPGDVSSAAFLVAAAALSGTELEVTGVGLNPSRLHVLEVFERMGIRTTHEVTGEEVGEPVGLLRLRATDGIRPTTVSEEELPLVIDEVPILAVVASIAPSESRFLGAGELRLKESDRLTAVAEGIRGMGGHAAVEGNDLVIAGGGLQGGPAVSGGDHRLAMAFAVAGIAAASPVEVDGMEAATVSYPGFVDTLRRLGARVEAIG